jgi:hypothetical protein
VSAEYDEIGVWSEVKLAIVRAYASEYSKILEASRRGRIRRLSWIYIDGYAGPGYHISKQTGEVVEGSPVIAMNIQHAGDRTDVYTYAEDCNTVLLRDVFPRAQHRDYRRALCLLDPYNIDLTWEVIEAAGKSNSIELFLTGC